jgi:hypothetical protein
MQTCAKPGNRVYYRGAGVWIALGGRTSPAVHTMNSTHQFHRLENSFTRQRIGERAGDGALRRLIAREVIDRFTRLGGPPVVFVETTAPALRQGMAYPLAPLHPECGAVADRSRCRQSWPRHWETLRQSREPIWHRCVNQRFCATVPLCCDGQCLAVMRLVCRNAITELDFLKHVEMLNVLVQGFAATHQDELARLVHPPATSAGATARDSPMVRRVQCSLICIRRWRGPWRTSTNIYPTAG